MPLTPCFVSQSILEYNGGAVIAMKGKDCVAIASDLRYGIRLHTHGTNFPVSSGSSGGQMARLSRPVFHCLQFCQCQVPSRGQGFDLATGESYLRSSCISAAFCPLDAANRVVWPCSCVSGRQFLISLQSVGRATSVSL